MSNLTIKKVRVGTDILMHVTLKDNGVKGSWKSVEDIFAFLFSDAQRIMAGRADVSIDPTDEYNLIVTYGVNEPQYLGVNRLVVSCVYKGKTATYDCPVVEFVEKSAEEGETTVEATQVDIEVSAVNTSLLDKAIDAAFAAAREALDATKTAQEGENSRQEGETLREEAEAARKAAETARTEAEAARAEAERARDVAEQERSAAEELRDTAEQAREGAETARQEAEAQRAQAEQTREKAEDAREVAELERGRNEAERQSAERERMNAEAARVQLLAALVAQTREQAEKTRAGARQDAESAESERQTAEEVRKQKEAARVIAENARDAAEQLREEAIEEVKAATAETSGMVDRFKLLLGYNAARSIVNLELGISGKYVKCETRSAVANSAFAISKPIAVDACSELLIKTGFNPSDAAHAALDLTVIAIYEEIERQRTVQKKDASGNPLYYVVTVDAETGSVTVTTDETTENTGYPVYTQETYTEQRYLPNNEDRFVAIPDSGYYVANIPQSCKVVISYKPGVSDTAVIVEKHGALANLISQVFGIYEHRTMVEAM